MEKRKDFLGDKLLDAMRVITFCSKLQFKIFAREDLGVAKQFVLFSRSTFDQVLLLTIMEDSKISWPIYLLLTCTIVFPK